MLSLVPGLGLVTGVQRVPSQCSMRVWFTAVPDFQPTAQAPHGDSTLVAVSTLSGTPELSAGVPDQLTQVAAEAEAVSRPVRRPASITGTRKARTHRMARNFQNTRGMPRMWRTLARPGGGHQ